MELAIGLAVASVVAGILQLIANRHGQDPGDATWVEGCYCCEAGCGDADDNNVCMICGH